MDIKQLKSFISVIDNRSFTKAAEENFISQPTVSAHIKQLEDEIGCSLIDRTTKSLKPTVQGNELYRTARRMLSLNDDFFEKIKENGHRLVIGASTIPSAYILPPILLKYKEENPDVSIYIRQSDSASVIKDMQDGIIDIGFIGIDYLDINYVCRSLCKDKLVIITQDNEYFRTVKASKNTLPLLVRQPFIMREQGSGSRSSAEKALINAGISPDSLKIVAEVSDPRTIAALVSAGIGISIISERAARADEGPKALLSIDPFYGEYRNINYIYSKKASQTPLFQAFLSLLDQMAPEL